jgi:hypothetical protein
MTSAWKIAHKFAPRHLPLEAADDAGCSQDYHISLRRKAWPIWLLHRRSGLSAIDLPAGASVRDLDELQPIAPAAAVTSRGVLSAVMGLAGYLAEVLGARPHQ